MTRIDLHAPAIVPGALIEVVARHPDFGPNLLTEDGTKYLKGPDGTSSTTGIARLALR